MSVTAVVLALAVAQGTPAAGVGGAAATADLVIEAGQSSALTAPVGQPLQHSGSARENVDGAVDYCSDFYQWGGYGGVIASFAPVGAGTARAAGWLGTRFPTVATTVARVSEVLHAPTRAVANAVVRAAGRVAQRAPAVIDRAVSWGAGRLQASAALNSADGGMARFGRNAAETVADTAGTLAKTASFVAGTKALIADGTRKAIEDVKVGDKVTSRNVDTGRDETHTVTRTFVHHDVALFDVTVAGKKITTTAEHPFFIAGKGWTPVKDLKSGDRLVEPGSATVAIDTGSATVAVDTVTVTGRVATVYNFEVDTTHDCYVQAGIHRVLVHNDCRGQWQITKEGTEATKTGPFGKVWKSKSDGLWWSRDTAHKGDTGLLIPWKPLG